MTTQAYLLWFLFLLAVLFSALLAKFGIEIACAGVALTIIFSKWNWNF